MTSSCAFEIKISSPLFTQNVIVDLLLNRNIHVRFLNLHCINETEGILLIHCSIERDRIRYTGHLLGKVRGVMEVEVLHAQISNLIKEY